jgi:two-component system sensor kinase FixL
LAGEELRRQDNELAGAHENLQAEHQRYLELSEFSPGGYLITDCTGVIQTADPAAATLLKRRAEYLQGQSLAAFVTDEARQSFRARLNRVLQEESVHEWKVCLQRYRSAPVPTVVRVSPARGAHGRVVGLHWLIRDVGECNSANAALRAQEAKLRAILDTAVDGIVTIDECGVIESFNPAAERMFGYSAREVIGQNVNVLMPSPNREEHDGYIARYRSTGEARIICTPREVTGLRKDGTTFPLELSVSVWCAGCGQKFTGMMRDVSERKQVQQQERRQREQLAHVARVSTVSSMAAGLVHEISQPLAAIVNYSQGCARRLRCGNNDPRALLGAMEQITAQAQQVGAITQRLRRFVSQGKPQRSMQDVNRLVEQAASLAQPEANQHGVALRFDLDDHLPRVLVDDIQVVQVIVNLLRNGLDAMIATELAQRKLSVRTSMSAGGEIEVAVSDTGRGLPADKTEQVFTPFFTTKSDGMGLGLAISRMIIEAHGGHLWLTSNQKRGVTFRFTLPVRIKSDAR